MATSIYILGEFHLLQKINAPILQKGKIYFLHQCLQKHCNQWIEGAKQQDTLGNMEDTMTSTALKAKS